MYVCGQSSGRPSLLPPTSASFPLVTFSLDPVSSPQQHFLLGSASYSYLRPLLLSSLSVLKLLRNLSDVQLYHDLQSQKIPKPNLFKRKFLLLHNLFYLFEFVLPALADYGVALKMNDWDSFKNAYLRLFRFFLSSKSQGRS